MSILRRPSAILLFVVTVLVTSLIGMVPAAAAGTVTVVVQGRGDVTGEGISCSESGASDCSEFYPNEPEECTGDPPHQVCVSLPPTRDLTAGPDRGGFAFTGFQGCDEVSARTCTVTVSTSRTVTAMFADVANPTVTLSAPSGAVRGSVPISATASDNDSVKHVEFYVRNTLVAIDTSAPYQTNWSSAPMSDGFATVSARAVDQVGRDATSSGSFTIDNTAPVLGVTGPDRATFGPGSTQTWTLNASDATSGVAGRSCAVAPAGTSPTLGACSGGSSHQVTGLAEGSYVFTARAVDAAGNTTTATRAFAIDATPPTSTIVSGHSSGSVSTSRTATFTMSASEPGASFACRSYPDGSTPPAFGACSGTDQHVLTGLADGGHTFEVKATDAVGNVEPSPVARTFRVDATAPETSFTKTPKAVIRTKKRKVTVRFGLAASEVGTFQCSLDGKAWKACLATTSYRVRRGTHTLRVVATDAAGNVDPTPATYRWKVKKKRR